MTTHLDDCDPIPIEDALAHELLNLLAQRRIHERRLGCDLRHERVALLLVRTLLEEYLRGLREDDPDQELDHLPAQVCRRRMEEVVVDVREHAHRRPEVVERAFETLRVRPIL